MATFSARKCAFSCLSTRMWSFHAWSGTNAENHFKIQQFGGSIPGPWCYWKYKDFREEARRRAETPHTLGSVLFSALLCCSCAVLSPVAGTWSHGILSSFSEHKWTVGLRTFTIKNWIWGCKVKEERNKIPFKSGQRHKKHLYKNAQSSFDCSS